MQIESQINSNILSFDVEEWFQVDNFEKYIPTSEWRSRESRINIGINFILEILDSFNIKATFFIVGWVAEQHPKMVEKIYEKGHEIGAHGYMHKNITDQTPEVFEKDLERGIKIISNITGQPVRGYRAPSYTITPNTVWALEILRQHGIEYDSSIYPISGHPTYGFPNAPCAPFQFKNGLYEFPMSTIKIGRKVIPFGSGGYFRHFPYLFTYYFMKFLNNRGKFLIINIHPWELDTDQKILKVDLINRIRHYANRSRSRKKFIKLLSHFKFVTFSEFIKCFEFPLVVLENGFFKFL